MIQTTWHLELGVPYRRQAYAYDLTYFLAVCGFVFVISVALLDALPKGGASWVDL